MHFPSSVGFLLLQILDYLPFLILPFHFKVRETKKILPSSIKFWRIVVLFLILSVGTTLIHNGSIMSSIGHFGAMFRYAPLALFISQKRYDEDSEKLIYHSFYILSVILISIGYIEIIGGESMKLFFSPLVQSFSSFKVHNSASINCIFPNTVDYSFFLVLSYIIISNRKGVKHKYILFFIYLIPLYYTGSKASLLIFILCAYYQIDEARVIKHLFGSLVCLCGIILVYQFWELFYWTVFIDSQASRLGYIIFTLPCFIEEFSIDTLLGLSPDSTIVHHKINSYPNAPNMTWDINNMSSFEDEFYVALIIYYGLIGFGLLVMLFFGLYKSLKDFKSQNKNFYYHKIINSLFIIILIAPLFNQIIILKPFSIFFWIWIGALTMRTTSQLLKN